VPPTLEASEHHGQVMFGGLPVPGATAAATQGEKKFTAVTDPQGVFSFPDLTNGVWVIQIEMLGFATVMREVTVASDGPGTEWELTMLPLNEIKAEAIRSVPVPTAPAIPESEPANSGAFANLSAEELNRRAADGLLVNGSVNNGAASPFAQLAAFGNNRRGPRPLYNGGIGVTVDHSALDARSFSLTGQDTPKPAYHYFQGSLTFGGPFKIPHLIRNGPTLFFNYQRTQNRSATTQSNRMPTLAQREGDFSQVTNPLGQLIPIVDPETGLPFPGNIIPEGKISPQARALMRLYPLPNFDGNARYNYQIPIVTVTHQDSLQSRLNKVINPKNQLFGNFDYQSTRTDTPNPFGFVDTARLSGINTALNWLHRFDQRSSITLRNQFSRATTRTMPYFANRINVSGEAGIEGNNQDPLNWGPPNLTFASGFTPLSDAQYSLERNQINAVSSSTFLNRGRHNLTFGGDFRRQLLNMLSQQDARGTFTFTGEASGSDFADFLLGVPEASAIAFGNADKYFRASTYDGFFTDDWRMSAGFTLNAGVRWEYEAPMTELYGRLVNLDIAPGFGAVAPVLTRTPTGSVTGESYAQSLVNPDKLGFQPRAAFAWRPFSASSLVIRAGYGVYRNTSVYQPIVTQLAQQPPLSKSFSVQNTPSRPLTLADGFNASPLSAPNTFAIDPNFRVGQAQNWQFSVQRDLPGSLQMTASYVGTEGTHLIQKSLPNTFPSGAANPCTACPTGFVYVSSHGTSTRHAGQFQMRRRLQNGFMANVQYTFSKSIDDAALGTPPQTTAPAQGSTLVEGSPPGQGTQPVQAVPPAQGGSLIAQDWLNLKAEKALSNFDQRHLLTAQAQYSTEMGLGGGALVGGWKGALLKEWTFTTQLNIGSGMPLTPIYLATVNGTGVTGSIRPDSTGISVYAAPPGLFLNPAAYRAPAPGRWGSAGRNSITGPGQFGLDASLGRTFRWGDRFNVDFRLDSTNVLNHATFPNWITTVTSAQFGLPSRANAMRKVQANLRLRF
jgi:hypothetical protein